MFGVDVPLRLVFEATTVTEMARRVEAAGKVDSAWQTTAIEHVSREGQALPLSFAQRRLWFLQQLEDINSAYYIHAVFRAKGQLNVTALEQTLSEIISRHETLRTTFHVVDGEPVQVIAPAQPTALPVAALGELPQDEAEAAIERWTREEIERPFDLERGSLVRVSLLRVRDDEHVLILTLHHIVADGWSMGVLVREAVALYRAYSNVTPSPLAELRIQYADYAVWQREWMQGEVLERQLDYWRRQLEGVPPELELPSDRPRRMEQGFRGASIPVLLSASLTEKLRRLSRSEGTTLFMTLLAAFQTLLYRYTGQEDIVVGTPIANRQRREIEELIGLFINSLALRVDLSDNPTFRELLARVRKVTLDAYAHQDVPFEKLVEELQPERALSRNPFF